MAGSDPQKQLLTLIRDFASEKSQGERRVVGLKKLIEELWSELDAENAELEDAKRAKETAEQELKGYEVELALNEASIQTLEARISPIQDGISTVGSDIEALQHKVGALRYRLVISTHYISFEDEFISQMFELNTRIRKFQEVIACNVHHESDVGTAAETEEACDVVSAVEHIHVKEVGEVALKTLEDTLAHIISQTTKEEEEYLAEQNFQKQVQQELIDYEKKVSLMDVIITVTKELEGVTMQTSELELTCASLGEELQRRCICPRCHLDNVEALDGFLQANEAN